MNIACRKNRANSWGTGVSLLLAAFFGVSASQAGELGGRISPFGSFIAAADLDGDRRPDVATAGASRRDGAGYALDITIRLSSLETGAITVRTARVAGRLFLRDLDGDADRDLILESFDREPLAVVLNDGDGHFHQVNLDDFRARLQRPASRSAEGPAQESDSPDTGESLDAPAARPQPSTPAPQLAAAVAPPSREESRVVLWHSVWASRGPPSSF